MRGSLYADNSESDLKYSRKKDRLYQTQSAFSQKIINETSKNTSQASKRESTLLVDRPTQRKRPETSRPKGLSTDLRKNDKARQRLVSPLSNSRGRRVVASMSPRPVTSTLNHKKILTREKEYYLINKND